ncbi:hypothetical protein HHSLTHF2_20250 [Vreelandella venusta]|uniref:Uncharacterized protein n=1 Tax=Halomonas hydrothermalis TaxID=115561 RepID=A0A6F8U5F2_9GAMM|nr:hypothetical protein [Halomonas hydrothermalis]BCB08135.1 hypothetical protein HHSLTHF2_20250 [Halomonas hydrothermalis]
MKFFSAKSYSAKLCCFAIFLFVTISVHGSDAIFESDDPEKLPFSVPVSQIQQRINLAPSADGIVMSIDYNGNVLNLDIKKIPGDTSIAAVLRVVMMIGRLVEQDYDEMRFVDDEDVIFTIRGSEIKEIGRQFVWGEQGKGQNPIHLTRLFADSLRTPDGNRVSPPMTGSLLGDTRNAMETINQRFHPEWTLRSLDIE